MNKSAAKNQSPASAPPENQQQTPSEQPDPATEEQTPPQAPTAPPAPLTTEEQPPTQSPANEPVATVPADEMLQRLADMEDRLAKREAALEAREKELLGGGPIEDEEEDLPVLTRKQLSEMIRKDYFEAEVQMDAEGNKMYRDVPLTDSNNNPLIDPATGQQKVVQEPIILRPPLNYQQLAKKYEPYHISISDVIKVIEGENSDAFKSYKKQENPDWQPGDIGATLEGHQAKDPGYIPQPPSAADNR